MILSRRSLITGLVSLVAAPAIVRAGSIMPVKAWAEGSPLWFDPLWYDPIVDAYWANPAGAYRRYGGDKVIAALDALERNTRIGKDENGKPIRLRLDHALAKMDPEWRRSQTAVA